MVAATIGNWSWHLMSVEERLEADWFSPHRMRRASATQAMSATWISLLSNNL